MDANPFLGVLFHWLGGLAAGSFYVPYRGVKKWSWETYWLVGGFFSWIICPWLLASVMTHDLVGVLRRQTGETLGWTYLFGVLWGVGGLTFGLAVRYLGLSLGVGVALGFCAALGTLLPPVLKSLFPQIPTAETLAQIAATTPGKVTLAGVVVCLLGIAIAALAGLTKEREMPTEAKKQTIAEFRFVRGILVATFAGVMSACMNFGITAGKPIGEASLAAGTNAIWTGLPALVVVLLGGFTTNCIWCVFLHLKHRSGYQYVASQLRPNDPAAQAAADAARPSGGDLKIPVLANYGFAALAGATWYFQFFFYTMGATQMGRYDFASWTLHMASIIIFSTMWGWILHEWRGSSKKAHNLIGLGISALVLSTIIIGFGTWLKSQLPGEPSPRGAGGF
jgi:L-rhamnose-H+ transport protein